MRGRPLLERRIARASRGLRARLDALPLTSFQEGVEASALLLTGRPKHCTRSAFRHLRSAWRLARIDPEMSAFRAITAEEEAATALILALKHRRYPGADRLDHRKHEQKVAITPFLHAVAKAFSDPDVPPPQIHISTKEPRVEISIDLSTFTDAPAPFFVSPDEPLNFAVKSDKQGGRMQAHRFERDFQAIAEGRGAVDILSYVRSEANMRNQLLYANDQGIPHVSFGDGFLLERLGRVCRLLILTIAVLQTPKHQLFVVQCLEAFLAALRKLDAPFFSLDSAMPKQTGPVVQIEQQPDGTYRTGMARHFVGHADIRYRLLPVWRI